jgi:hypothetical protein
MQSYKDYQDSRKLLQAAALAKQAIAEEEQKKAGH